MSPLLSLFGGDDALTVIIALAVVIILIVVGVWALKLVFNATGRASRGRAKRLAVVDVSPVDSKRQLVLVRRDNVEHLLLIGGAQDLVIEAGIYSGPPLGRPMRPSQPAQAPGPQAQPVAPPPAQFAAPAPAQQPVPPVQAATPAGPARVRGTNLPPDLVATRSTAGAATRGSLRHSALLRPSERQEPDFIPSPPPPPSAPPTDSGKQSEAETAPEQTGDGSEPSDYRDEPQFDGDGDDTREAHKDN